MRSLAIVLAITAALALQVLQPSVVNPAVRTAISAGIDAPVARPGRPSMFLLGTMSLHLAVVCLALLAPDARRRLKRYRMLGAATLAYGVAAIITTDLATGGLTRVVQASAIPLTILSFTVCLPALLDERAYDTLFRGVVGVLAVTSSVSLALVMSQSSTFLGLPLIHVDQRGGALAAVGLFEHRNTIGAFLECGPALAVYLMMRAVPGRRALLAAALAVISLHLLLTFSRSSQVVAAISLLPALRPVRARPRMVIGIAAIAAAVIAVVWLVPEFRAYAALGASLQRRQDIWMAMVRQALDHPWRGYGLQNVTFLAHGVRYGPHNLYLAQLVYFGVFGLVTFIGVLAALAPLVVQRARADADWTSWLIGLLIAGVLLQGMVEYILTAPIFFANSVFWILAGFAARPRAAEAYSTS